MGRCEYTTVATVRNDKVTGVYANPDWAQRGLLPVPPSGLGPEEKILPLWNAAQVGDSYSATQHQANR